MSASAIWEAIKPYKELLATGATLITMGAVVFNHFATASSLSRAECRLGNKIVIVDSQMAIARNERSIAETEAQMRSNQASSRSAELKRQVKRYETELDKRRNELETAEKVLRDNSCEESMKVSGK